MSKKAEIVGAGPVGLAIAVALSRIGWSVRVHEAAPSLRPSGGGLYIQSQGVKALKALQLHDVFERIAWRPAFFETRIDGVRSTYEANTDLFHTMLRQDLHDLLERAARQHGAEIITGSHVETVGADGVVTLADGGRCEADLVVAANGVGSRAFQDIGIAQSRERFSEGLVRVLASRRFLRGAQWDGSIDFWVYHERPLRLLYTPCGADYCYIALMAPISDADALALPPDADLWSGSFPDFEPVLRQAGNAARFDRYGKITLGHWSKGRVVIVGDAAHAMPSSRGQGANVGIGNAVALASFLDGFDDLEEALRCWEQTQRPAVETIQDEAVRLVRSRALDRGRPEQEPHFVPGATHQQF
jgi:2-methyl-3-hydroxypyridine 5-carboxylic acid dioxygenase